MSCVTYQIVCTYVSLVIHKCSNILNFALCVTGNRIQKIDSVSQIHTISGRHCFEVQNYLNTKKRGIGKYIRSSTFFVGGYEWAIKYYPHGHSYDASKSMSVFLQFKSISGKPRTSYTFSFLNYTTGEPAHTVKIESHTFKKYGESFGLRKHWNREKIEVSECLKEDSLTIICDLTVIKEPMTYTDIPSTVPVSPSNIHERLSDLLASRKGVDIIVEVGDKCFFAHRIVLAASSQVFEAQIFGQTREAEENKIKITDMEPPVFDAMLHFIYNDTLPKTVKDTDTTVIQHLLVAADRYMLKRLRITCEQKLSKSLDSSNVNTTLALAEQHNLTHLKDQCIGYLSSKEALSHYNKNGM
jgi:speckle-type POZ protein